MSSRVLGIWLPSVLLLLQVPGCFPLRGPSTVTGTVGRSLSVQCQYEEEYKTLSKYWCRESLGRCPILVETTGSVVKKGQVSIRDHPANLTFTVTLERLTLEDAGTYQCGVDVPAKGFDESFKIMVFVLPGTTTLYSTEDATGIQPGMTREDTASPSPQPESKLDLVRFLLLIFLELPLLLSMLGAVLWVNRPQRCLWRDGVNQ